jgi:hypothetical protein
MNSQRRKTAMLIRSIGRYAKQLPKIQAREIITTKIQRTYRKNKRQELTGVCTVVAELR